MNDTLDPKLRSWVESAHDPATEFPIQNLPFGVFRRAGSDEAPRVGVAIGDQILDLCACLAEGLLEDVREGPAAIACAAPSLNVLMSLGRAHATALRAGVSRVLRAGGAPTRYDRERAERILVPMADAELFLPADVGDYTDFYASVFHATNVGRLFRPDQPLLPNYKWVPIGYHGRASSIVRSGTPVRRPHGQTKRPDDERPTFGPTRQLDYELELGFYIGAGTSLGQRLAIDDAESHLFGVSLVNDWSARDVQSWEYQPLGPFLAKSFATTVSPWVVTLDALEPFRRAAFARPEGDPAPLPHLVSVVDQARGAFDVTLEVWLSTARMRDAGLDPCRVSHGSFADMYWTPAQLVTHHTSNGCNLRPGDLLASGTVSGPEPSSRGCLLELTTRGAEPLSLPGGETRAFLDDGDEVILRGYCEAEGAVRIGLGECRGLVVG
ncbi:fumarylacetoacetase [Gemmatirosa kalamazoonensis]|uniref:fumarylacetoacetase n=1 Tax=Gemmatirosa kalamazoonensis TaxID=861299 RepID=W0RGG1_9BACT|nr:fumarylacetoacetase [Gemmatirosa kalamazoonensis]AHG89866.1 fumarylacetoacetase [Gemmatirosa kalamazoonensis]